MKQAFPTSSHRMQAANTSFYIRADGVPVVAFAKYEIAAGAAGIPEFPITVE